ncbi:hypothetical protein W02_31910 [Nitrospira sp. KM1]|uniref:hypothetical protein n=1 Tax=Nitrospira sp. KM1 TaxID=1936990 RepID=UPI0013A7A3CE|nr:hypothetical protein [Nitrospira sp. KM1]BCA56051.1 hypothetical protein W02_31910 [Nitrospira sp. KM1]
MTKQFPELADFQKCTRALAKLLDGDPHLQVDDQLSIENHLQIMQLAYGAWLSRYISRSRKGVDQEAK